MYSDVPAAVAVVVFLSSLLLQNERWLDHQLQSDGLCTLSRKQLSPAISHSQGKRKFGSKKREFETADSKRLKGRSIGNGFEFEIEWAIQNSRV